MNWYGLNSRVTYILDIPVGYTSFFVLYYLISIVPKIKRNYNTTEPQVIQENKPEKLSPKMFLSTRNHQLIMFEILEEPAQCIDSWCIV